MQDMIPPGERSIRNIPLSKKQAIRAREDFPENLPPPRPPRRRPLGRVWIWAVLVVAAAGLLGILSSVVFAGAVVVLHPRTETIAVPATIEAGLNPPLGQLQYQQFSISRSATTTVPASGTQKVSKQAGGVVTIYNTYSSASQRLIANTRFAAPDGKIYKIRDSVVVPGTTKGAGGAVTPGSVVATIYADVAGADYNRSEKTTFTIPGFKGDPRYTKFYAESEGAIAGGFVGTQPAVAAADLAAAKTALEQGLASAVTAAANSSIPEGYLMVPGTMKITYGEAVQTPAGNSQANISEAATATGAIVKLSDLATALAKKGVTGYSGEAVAFADPAQMSLSATSSKQAGTLLLELAGSPTLVWQYDSAALRDALLGKPKAQFESVLRDFGATLDCSETTPCSATIRPFWASTFPKDPERIDIVTK